MDARECQASAERVGCDDAQIDILIVQVGRRRRAALRLLEILTADQLPVPRPAGIADDRVVQRDDPAAALDECRKCAIPEGESDADMS